MTTALTSTAESAKPAGGHLPPSPQTATPIRGVPAPRSNSMTIIKRDGREQRVDPNRIIRVIEEQAVGLERVDPLRIATRTIGGLNDGATTLQMDELSIRLAAELATQEPEYSLLAARLLARVIEHELEAADVRSFTDSIAAGARVGLLNERLISFAETHKEALNAAAEGRTEFEYFGLKTVHDRYLLRHPTARTVLEGPRHFLLRVACSLSENLPDALALFKLMSNLEYLPSSPTLFNAGTKREQMSSCFLLDSPADHLDSIYDTYKAVARLSKLSGGIGLAFHRVRSRGSLIESTNGHSSGIVPWLRTLDSSVAAVNQGGKRKGACCVYLESWHADIEEFLELRDNTGEEARRAHNLNIANWVSDLFMRRVEADEPWSLFDPKTVPQLPDLHGEAFEQAYVQAEQQGLAQRTLPARQLYARMMRTLAETGNGWMTFKDRSNQTCNQTAGGDCVHLSNLCTEILEVNSGEHSAVCNLGSLNVSRFYNGSQLDIPKLHAAVHTAVRALDRVIDYNHYATERTRNSNRVWRPIGLGVMGLADVFFKLGLPYDSEDARKINRTLFEELYFAALSASADLADAHGAHPAFERTRAARGELQFDYWPTKPQQADRWKALRLRVQQGGLRNSLLLAVAPTATIASIAGCYECIEPQVSNVFKRETLSGDFIQINRYLVRQLQDLGLWTESTRGRLKAAGGSVQGLTELSKELREVYRTAWELPMKSLIDMASERGAFIDQSQSLNLFVESPSIEVLSSMYYYAWKRGLKTTYYLRSRPATRITQTTIAPGSQKGVKSDHPSDQAATAVDGEEPSPKTLRDAAALACSLENPESCEACQ